MPSQVPIEWIMFFVVGSVLLTSATAMILSRNFVHSVVFLTVSLLSFAALFALLDATFLALLQVLIYAGASTVVLVFVVMLTRPEVAGFRRLLQPQTGFAVLTIVALAVPLFGALRTLAATLPVTASAPAGTRALAAALLGPYAAPFEIASVVLLAALVGAIHIAREAE
jgi:NADH-quinone oxidoreductase subunit J